MAGQSTIVTCPNCGRRNRVRATSAGVPRCSVCHSLLPWIVDTDEISFDEEVHASVPVLVDFWAPWCGPCRMVSPLVARVVGELAGSLKVAKVNVDQAPHLSERYGIRGIPLLVLFRDGDEVDRLVGAATYEQLRAWLERHLEPASERA